MIGVIIRKLICSATIAATLISPAFSGTLGPSPLSTDDWVIRISGGSAWTSPGKEQTFYLLPGFRNTYTANKSTTAVADGALFLGQQKTLDQGLQGQIGVTFAMAGNARLQGDIWDDAEPLFNNHTYQYKIQHTHLAVEGGLLFEQDNGLIPWLSASIGVGFNRSYAFSNQITIPEARVEPNFTSNTVTAFTYTVGIGIQKAIKKQVQFGVGYLFSDWGKSSLDRATGQTLNSGLSLSHLYTNGVLFNLTYLT